MGVGKGILVSEVRVGCVRAKSRMMISDGSNFDRVERSYAAPFASDSDKALGLLGTAWNVSMVG
jgi:hypothetical protein